MTTNDSDLGVAESGLGVGEMCAKCGMDQGAADHCWRVGGCLGAHCGCRTGRLDFPPTSPEHYFEPNPIPDQVLTPLSAEMVRSRTRGAIRLSWYALDDDRWEPAWEIVPADEALNDRHVVEAWLHDYVLTHPEAVEAAIRAPLEAALRTIRDGRIPQVCAEFETCRHDGCRASHEAYEVAAAALAGVPKAAPAMPSGLREAAAAYEDLHETTTRDTFTAGAEWVIRKLAGVPKEAGNEAR